MHVVVIVAIAVAATLPMRPAAPTVEALEAAAPVQERPESKTLHACRHDGLASHLRCTTVAVSEDHRDPTSRRIELAVVVVPADPAAGPKEPDPVFFLSGGPGQGATGAATAFAEGRTGPMARRDVVLVDQRGTGNSNPLACSLASSPAEHFDGVLSADSVLMECLAAVSQRADPRLYTTLQSTHDLDAVRRALGYGAINLRGTSYGTRVALEYARRYPATLRTMVLQGVAPQDFKAPLLYARYAQEALDALFADCRAEPACAGAYPDLERAWREVVERLRRTPAIVQVPDVDGTAVVVYDADDFAYTVRTMMYGSRALSLPAMLYQSWRTGDLSTFAEIYAARAEGLWSSLAQGLHLSVFCAEDVPFIADSDAERSTRNAFLGMYLIDEYRRGCRMWPRGDVPDDFFEPVRSDAPALVLSGRRDPSTPPANGEQVLEHLPNGAHLIHPWGGHGFPGTPDTGCVSSVLDAFLESASTQGLELSCTASERPLPFLIAGIAQETDESRAGARPAVATPATSPPGETPVLTEADLDREGQQVAWVEVDVSAPTPTSTVFRGAVEGGPDTVLGSGRMPRFGPSGVLARLTSGPDGLEVRLVGIAGEDLGVVGQGAGVLDYAWSPDGRRIAYAARPGDGSDVRLFVHDLTTGVSNPVGRVEGTVHTDAFGAGGAFDWSPDGSMLAFAMQASATVEGAYATDLFTVEVSSEIVRPLVRRPGMDVRPRWSPDGTRVAFTTSFGRRHRFGRHGLAVVTVATGEVLDAGLLDETFLEAPSDHAWSADGDALYVSAARGVSTRIVRVPLLTDVADGTDTRAGAATPMLDGSDAPGTDTRLRLSANGARAVFLRSDPGRPWELRLADLATGHTRRVRSVGEPSSPAPRWDIVRWTNRAGYPLEGILYSPDGGSGPPPLLTWLHGGPDGRAAAAFDPSVPFPTPSFDPLPLRLLLERGYAVFLPNHRAGAGHPEEVRVAVSGRYGDVLAEDVLSGIDALVDAGRADADRLLLGGWASGGMAATILLTRSGDRFAGAVTGASNTDLEAAYGDGDFPVQWHSLFGGPPWQARGAWDAASPLRNAPGIRTRLLILHGAADPLVPVDQSRYLHTYLTGLERPVRLDVLDGVGHGVVLPEHRRDAGERIVAWFETWSDRR